MPYSNLLVTGGINHDFEDTALALAEVLADADIESKVCTDIEDAFALLAENKFDLLTMFTLRWRMLDDDKYIPFRKEWAYEIAEENRQLISEHLQTGRGMLGLHTASICFDTWPEWPSLLGAGWVWGRTFHPPPEQIRVHELNGAHPVTRSLDGFELVDEIYHHLQPAQQATPLFSTVSSEDESVQTLAWANEPLGGRVVYDALCHDRASVTEPGHARFLKNAARWCCGETP